MKRIGLLAEITPGSAIPVTLGVLRTNLYPRQKVKIVAQHQNNDQFDNPEQGDDFKLYMVEWEVTGLCMDDDDKPQRVTFVAFVRGDRLDTDF
jgi:hypothetical protein